MAYSVGPSACLIRGVWLLLADEPDAADELAGAAALVDETGTAVAAFVEEIGTGTTVEDSPDDHDCH